MTRPARICGCLLLGALDLACSSDGATRDTAAADRVFATVATGAEVLELDARTHERVASVPVGAGPAIILATSDGRKLYTADWADGSVTSIDTKTLATNVMQMEGRPYVIALSPDGKRLYVGVSTVSAIVVIDTETDEVVSTFSIGELPASIIVSPDGKTLYVAFLGLFLENGRLVALDAETGEEQHSALATGWTPAWITIGKDGSRVYTLNFLTDDITVVDTDAWETVTTISTGEGSQAIIGNVTPDGSRLYVTNHGTGELMGIDTDTNEIVQTIELDGSPVGVNFTPDGSRVWTTDFGVGSLEEPADIGLTYLLSGVYNGANPGQIREFDVQTGVAVGETIATDAGATSVVILPAK